MRTAGAADGVGRAHRGGPGRDEMRCPSCARLLVLRSGPGIRPHFAHRPRQSCRRRPGGAPVTPWRLEQLTLFDPAAFDDELWAAPDGPSPLPRPPRPKPSRRRSRNRRRRRAWLPRLIRWVTGRANG